jgi:hypothetical protein
MAAEPDEALRSRPEEPADGLEMRSSIEAPANERSQWRVAPTPLGESPVMYEAVRPGLNASMLPKSASTAHTLSAGASISTVADTFCMGSPSIVSSTISSRGAP